MKKNKKVFSWSSIVGGLLLLIIISWMTIETGIEISSHADFCGVCHAMEPMVKSYHISTHGGNNPRGVMAGCTDCHVSHKNVFTHFVGKARSGTHDAWVTITRISPRSTGKNCEAIAKSMFMILDALPATAISKTQPQITVSTITILMKSLTHNA